MLDNDRAIRGEIYEVELELTTQEFIQRGRRPCVVIQNNKGNYFSPTVIVVPFTSRFKKNIDTHVLVKKSFLNGLQSDSTAMTEQIFTINKDRLEQRIGRLSEKDIKKLNKALIFSLELEEEDEEEDEE